MVNVPPQYMQWVQEAAQQLGIPVAVVAAQIDHESGFDNNSVGQYGEKGIVQFLPSTWSEYSSGSQTDLSAELNAYVSFMKKLLAENGGNVYKALSAYNGDISGNAGYARTILDNAGLPNWSAPTTDNSGVGLGNSNVGDYIPQPATLSLDQLRSAYPMVWALLTSVPELQSIATQATNNQWSTDKIIASIQNSQWYSQHSDTFRQAIATAMTDPSTWNQNINNLEASMRQAAAQLGATLTPQQVQDFAIQAIQNGWDQNTAVMNQKFADFVKPVSGNHFGGQAGSYEDQIRQAMLDLGVSMPESQLDNQIQQIVAGKQSVQGVNAQLRTQSASMYPAYSQQINSGMNLSDIASPFISRAQQLLEMGPGSMNINTPLIKSALQYTQDGQPTAMPMYDFEKSVRQDPRWLSTDNAQDAFMSNAHQVLVNFGFEY